MWVKTLDAWGPHMPDWIEALAKACDRESQRKVAALLSVSPATINLLINNKYAPRSHEEMKARVRASALMMTIVPCPVLGVIGKPECLKEQAKPLVTCNPLSVQLYRACRDGCPFFTGEKTA
jgi:hypothetical protein